MAVLAAAAFITSTAAARADVMPAGTWDGKVTGGTLGLGDRDVRPIEVPAGDPFTFTIPERPAAPVTFRAPSMHIPIPVKTMTDSGVTRAVSGSLDTSPIDATVDPATGAVTAAATAYGLLRLDAANDSGGSSLYCQLGSDPPPPNAPVPPSPFALSLETTSAWSAGSGQLTLGDTTFALQLNCGAPYITPDTDLPIIGHPVMESGENSLALTLELVRRADPPPPVTNTVTNTVTKIVTKTVVVTPPPNVTPEPVKCVVPKLKGLSLKKARKAAKKANCRVGKIRRKSSSRKATTVLKQGHKRGTVLANGAKIAITVAKKK